MSEVDNTKVICPACCHQFRAIPVQVQRLMLDAGFEPPFLEPAHSPAALPVRDREADRQRFPDAAFNRWLDEGISDAGHTVWDQIHDVCDAWHGWTNRPFYDPARPALPDGWLAEAERLVHRLKTASFAYGHYDDEGMMPTLAREEREAHADVLAHLKRAVS